MAGLVAGRLLEIERSEKPRGQDFIPRLSRAVYKKRTQPAALYPPHSAQGLSSQEYLLGVYCTCVQAYTDTYTEYTKA